MWESPSSGAKRMRQLFSVYKETTCVWLAPIDSTFKGRRRRALLLFYIYLDKLSNWYERVCVHAVHILEIGSTCWALRKVVGFSGHLRSALRRRLFFTYTLENVLNWDIPPVWRTQTPTRPSLSEAGGGTRWGPPNPIPSCVVLNVADWK